MHTKAQSEQTRHTGMRELVSNHTSLLWRRNIRMVTPNAAASAAPESGSEQPTL